MADYWKSQAKKYCEFCKCWLADNKPSIEFHEKGKRHKENVQRRLGEITKKSVKEEKEKLQVDNEIKKMEKAAMKAYLKDVESNPDFSSQIIQEMAASLPKSPEEPKSSTSAASSMSEKNLKSSRSKHSTNEQKAKIGNNQGQGKKQLAGQKLIKTEGPVIFGPAPKAEPYGTWKSVEPSTASVDLELPEQKNLVEYIVPDLSEETKIKFKEKKVESLGSGDGSSVSFKKRKINCNQKRNVRQRLDEND